MNERLTIQDLTDLLAAKHSMTKKDAEAFVKEFFLLIEQALENEKTVKIKGLGTFKLIDVDSGKCQCQHRRAFPDKRTYKSLIFSGCKSKGYDK